ncbi:hypothetical protein Sango_2077000 [Sesamum angolense]|uniref:GAG-pre-integrase domain-containing protein n=1 Tax=Sesamum angolense TaxID=2727404 RepID=A0AAE2BLV8_9LAMI|nr:hypothetical protein Sango_2077000 [Sesamum angolense]
MEFLMGLHESYDSERSQILMMEPLPNIQRVYAMLLRIERQRSVQIGMTNAMNNTAYQLAIKENKKEVADRFFQKKKGVFDKCGLVCENCNKPGHSKDTCFKLHDIPDWYKILTDQKKKELLKLVKTNMPADPVTVNFANFVHHDDEFATNLFLPDGSQKSVSLIGIVKLSQFITLEHVIHILDFAVNLISASQLCNSNAISCFFSQSHCYLQDQVSKDVLAAGTLVQKLYVLTPTSFKSSVTESSSFIDDSCSTVTHYTKSVLHMRLGHASMQTISHKPLYQTLVDDERSHCDICHLAKQTRVPFSLNCFHFASTTSTAPSCPLPTTFPSSSYLEDVSSLHPPSAPVSDSLPALVSLSESFDPTFPVVPNSSISTDCSSQPNSLCRSTPTSHKPSWLDDFVCHQSTPFLLQSNNSGYISFVASLSILQEPRSFIEAVQHSQWQEAMEQELLALEKNRTWTLTPSSSGKATHWLQMGLQIEAQG